MNNSVHKINDNYFINLDNFVDIDFLKNNYKNLVKSVVTSKDSYDFLIPMSDEIIFKEETQIYKDFQDLNEFIKSAEYTNLLKDNFSKKDIIDYYFYLNNIDPVGMKLVLKYPESIQDRMSSRNSCFTKAYKNFEVLDKWLSKLDIFKEIGTIVLYINKKGSRTLTHRDFDSRYKLVKNQGIWINLYQKKKFYVLDENFEKQYINSEVALFDLNSWHGSDITDQDCFTFRIDGYFTESFLEKTNLKGYFSE